jgi:hypothetical protein
MTNVVYIHSSKTSNAVSAVWDEYAAAFEAIQTNPTVEAARRLVAAYDNFIAESEDW